ncbi:MAG: phosphoribosylanthranilate isomerase [Pirellulaceae bacterium]
MYRIKICGIASTGDALLAAEAGADAIGLNFYEQSPRFVSPQRASEIVAAVRRDYAPDRLAIFGVFVNAPAEQVLQAVPGEIDVQLHGDEPAELLAELRQQGIGPRSLVRAFRSADGNLAAAASYLQTCQRLGALPQAVLLDAHHPGTYGGTGQRLDWKLVRDASDQLAGLPIVLAGGLTPDNVAEAIRAARPAAVDTASGVEASPGKKDAAKVRAFVAQARQAFEQLATVK